MSPEQVAARQAFDKMLEADAAESGDEIGAHSPRESVVHFDPYMFILPSPEEENTCDQCSYLHGQMMRLHTANMKLKEDKQTLLTQCQNWKAKCLKLRSDVNKLVDANLDMRPRPQAPAHPTAVAMASHLVRKKCQRNGPVVAKGKKWLGKKVANWPEVAKTKVAAPSKGSTPENPRSRGNLSSLFLYDFFLGKLHEHQQQQLQAS